MENNFPQWIAISCSGVDASIEIRIVFRAFPIGYEIA
jgi:hypothetical protein